jgi:hypothetical protein
VSSPIEYPDWFKGGFPNAEDLVKTLFAPLLTGVTAVSWLPAPKTVEETLKARSGYLRVYRTGGKINREQNRDEPNVQFVALTRSRDDSWDLIEFVRQVLEQFESTAIVPGTIHKMHCAGELLGPQLTPGEMRDERIVPVTFTLHTWKPKGLGNYREALGL